jgi:DNA-binding transcriptional ArsR family regulator
MLKTVAELKIDTISNRKAAETITAINHKLRRKMLKLIHKNGRMTVTQIYKHLRIEQSRASKFLGMLRAGGFVVTEREGKFTFYSLHYQMLRQVLEKAENLDVNAKELKDQELKLFVREARRIGMKTPGVTRNSARI